MDLNTWEIAFVIILMLIGCSLIFTFITSYKFKKNLDQKILTRGMNGIEGSTINMTCPSGQKIKVYKANYVCSSGSITENPECDPYWRTSGQKSNFFNPLNTFDVSSQISSSCDGKELCVWNIPKGSSMKICGQSSGNTLDGSVCTGQLQLIGTYDCVPE